ncbi:MAG: hypothetical protein M1821_002389 [Bathelium mastoideum]|nr:MAG: hypothetical protein M1821_002389 [Bathelium mastoideum]KAI9686401.1 MAG: hypothetical protein M1822_003746 [Bathelium mastoideum]
MSALITAPSVSASLWEQALYTLSERDQNSIRSSLSTNNAVLQDLLSVVEQKRDLCQQRGWKYEKSNGEQILIRDVVDKIARWINRVKEIGDIVANYDPAHASLPWAVIRVILQITVNEAEIFGAMTEGLEQVSRTIAHYAIFEAVYCEQLVKVNQPLLHALVRLYAAILVYLTQAGRFYEKSVAKRIAKSTFTSPQGAVGDLIRQIHVEESSVIQLAKLADAEVALQTQAQVVEVQKRQMQLESYYAEDRNRLQSMCDSLQSLVARLTIQVEELHAHKIEPELQDSLQWPITNQYRQRHAELLEGIPSIPTKWLTYKQDRIRFDSSSIHWLQSSHAANTSKAMALVAEALLQKAHTSPEAALVAFFYCHCTESGRTKSHMIAQAIIEQLTLPGSDGEVPSDMVYMHKTKTTGNLDLKECIGLVLSLTKRRPARIIIDKVDECGPDCRDEVLDALRTIVNKSHFPVKVLISSSDPADRAVNFEDVSTMNLRHSLELAAVKSPFIESPQHDPTFHIVEDQLIREMESFGERTKRLMPVPDDAFWCDLLHLEILISTLHSQKTMKDELQDPLGYIFRRILGRVASDAFNFHAREIGAAALTGAYSAKSPVPQKVLIQRIGLVWPIRGGVSTEDVLQSCHGFLILRDDDCFDLAHDLLVEQVRLDRKELLHAEFIPDTLGVVCEVDEQDELKRAMDGATMLLEKIG